MPEQDNTRMLILLEERTRLLPDIDKRTRTIEKNQVELQTKVERNEDDIEKVVNKVDNLNIIDKVWNGANTLAIAILIYLQTGKMP